MDEIRTSSMVWSGDLLHELMIFKQYVTLIFKGPLSKLKTDEGMMYDVCPYMDRRRRSYNI